MVYTPADTLDLSVLEHTVNYLIQRSKQRKIIFETYYYFRQILELSFPLKLRNMYEVCVCVSPLFLAVLKSFLAVTVTE